MGEPQITNLVKLYTLLLLWEKKHHGYELMKEIGKKLEKKISPGQMYPFLAALEKSMLVKATATGNRDKTQFQLTNTGKKFVHKQLQRFGGLLEIAMEPRLTVCTHCGCKVFEGGVIEEKFKFCCHHCAHSYFNKKHHH